MKNKFLGWIVKFLIILGIIGIAIFAGKLSAKAKEDGGRHKEKIEKVILFHWNRDYPADTYFTLDISGWTLEESEEIAGYSHEKITKEIYNR